MADTTTPTPFQPINTPPSDYDPPATGLSTEKGDSFKTAMEKVNAGFAHIYSMMTGDAAQAAQTTKKAGAGALAAIEARVAALEGSPKVTNIAEVAKADFDAVKAKVDELAGKAESVAVADFEATKATIAKLQADVADFSERFNTLAEKIEAFLGLAPKK